MKTICKMLINFGKIFLIWDTLFIMAIVFNSLTIKGEVNYGNRCFVNEDFSYIKNYKYNNIDLKNNELKCNTYYLNYYSESDKKGAILFLNDISKLLMDNESKANVHVTINSSAYQIMASIVNYKVTYIETNI